MQSKYSPQLNLNKHGYNKVSMFVCCCDSVAEEADGAEGGGRTFGYRDVLQIVEGPSFAILHLRHIKIRCTDGFKIRSSAGTPYSNSYHMEYRSKNVF